jgi:hypothetical protein
VAERKPEGVKAGQNGGDSTQAGMMAHNHLTRMGLRFQDDAVKCSGQSKSSKYK